MRVLQVEDDAATAQTVERMLTSKGYVCETTALGEQAVKLATQNAYDLILLDIMLPDIDGYEVLRQLQAANVATPILIQSALVSRDDVEKGQGFGVDDYLIKPYTQAELTERIETTLARANDNQTKAAKADEAEDEFDRRTAPRDVNEGRRKHARIKTLKSAQVILEESGGTRDCIVINMSDGGAAIQLTANLDMPQTFRLKIQQGPAQPCEVCWRHGNKLGIRFLHD